MAARYAPFRLMSVFRSAIFFPGRYEPASLAEEADALVQIHECHFRRRAIANIIWLIAELDGSRRAEFVSQLAKPYERGILATWTRHVEAGRTSSLRQRPTPISSMNATMISWQPEYTAAYRREQPLCFDSDSVAGEKSAAALMAQAYEREHPSTRLAGEPTAMVLDRTAVPDDTATRQLAVERQQLTAEKQQSAAEKRQRQLPLTINGVDDKEARPQGADMSPASPSRPTRPATGLTQRDDRRRDRMLGARLTVDQRAWWQGTLARDCSPDSFQSQTIDLSPLRATALKWCDRFHQDTFDS